MGKPRHAIVLVHGQGEQRPKDMGPQFVEHVFMADFDPATASAASNPQVRWVACRAMGRPKPRTLRIRTKPAFNAPARGLRCSCLSR